MMVKCTVNSLFKNSILFFVTIYLVQCDKKVEIIKRGPICGENEDYLPCLHPCPPDSCGINQREIDCAPPSPEIICSPGCRCSQGYLRDSNGKCILKDKCPPICSLYEVYDTCGPTCQDSCDKRMETSGCRQKCVAACFCIKGYIRDNNRKCVKIEDCKSCNGDMNAHSGCNTQCNAFCDTYNKTNIACAGVCPIVGCTCNKGYVQDNNLNKCVKPEDCTPKCGIYETYDKCGSTCEDSCNKRVDKSECRLSCQAGCFCAKGYIRDDNRNCIKIEDCKSCNNDFNAHPGCENHCGNSCDTYNRTDFGCSGGCLDAGCVCNKEYVYDFNIKKCVKPEQCTPKCRVNEVFDKCGPTCEDRCEKRANPANCRDKCVAGCFCKEGFIRDVNGRCIKPNECSSCNGDRNARPGCGSACRPTCSNTVSNTLEQPTFACKAPCIFEGCDCVDGFIFDDNTKKCVKPEDCNEKLSCCGDRNATCVVCPNPCEPTCLNPNPPKICLEDCEECGCECKKGYLLDTKSNMCIRPLDCPKIYPCNGDENAEAVSCPDPCPKSCQNLDPILHCLKLCKEYGCQCKPGFILDEVSKKCVEPLKCLDIAKTPCNGDDNAILVICPNPCAPTCQVPRARVCTKACVIVGCECKRGFIFNQETRKCVKPENCPKLPTGCYGDANAEMVSCPTPCPANCKNPNRNISCGATCADTSGCQCKDGFILNRDTGKCVKLEDCPPNTCPAHEVWVECPKTCPPNTCHSPTAQYKCQLPQPPKDCMPACMCQEGYLRDSKGVCIPEDQCVKPICSINETYSDNIYHCNTCEALSRSFFCKEPKEPISGCDCNEKYFRNGTGYCVLEKDCNPTSCKGDPNAIRSPGCGNPCPRTCQNGGIRPEACPKVCLIDSCDCKEGFLLDMKINMCVRPK